MTEDERDSLLICIDERLNNHLAHHERDAATKTKWLIALTVLVCGLVSEMILGLI